MNTILSFYRTTFSKDKELYRYLKNIFGITPRNIFLYKLAFTHKSGNYQSQSGQKINNERLEYLGDSILGAIVATYLFRKYPNADEGFLSETRSKIVKRDHLNKLSAKTGLSEYIQKRNDNLYYKSINGDVFEAFIGALYIDKGYKYTYHIITHHIIPRWIDVEELLNTETNYKSRIIEYAQRNKFTIDFRVADVKEFGKRKEYCVEVLLNGEVLATGIHLSIKSAEQLAAERAYLTINSTELSPVS
ncbi:MAG: ribonuclease III [Bacteroidota bacterium]